MPQSEEQLRKQFKEQGLNTFAVGKDIAKLAEILDADEKVYAEVVGKFNSNDVKVYITDKNMVVLTIGFFKPKADLYPIHKVDHAQYVKGMMHGKIDISYSGMVLTISKVSSFQDISDIINTIAENAKSKLQIKPTSQDPLEQLEKLSVLLQKGVVTKEEFDAKKKQLLDL